MTRSQLPSGLHFSTDIATLWVLSVSTAKVGPNFRVADQTGVLRVALCFATSRPDTLENTWKDEVFRVFSQSFFSRESVSVLSLVGQCEISESYRLSQRLRAQQISARAVGREGVGRFHQTW